MINRRIRRDLTNSLLSLDTHLIRCTEKRLMSELRVDLTDRVFLPVHAKRLRIDDILQQLDNDLSSSLEPKG